jgi:hypothetical protein
MKTFIIALALLLTGCATGPDPYAAGNMLPGKLTSLSDGHVIPVQIELQPMSHPTGTMTGIDPVTGEQFSGNYTFIVETKVVRQSQPGLLFDEDTSRAVQTSNVAPGTAVLVGDKGTVINLTITAKAGSPPVGLGNGEDNKGRKYTLQF